MSGKSAKHQGRAGLKSGADTSEPSPRRRIHRSRNITPRAIKKNTTPPLWWNRPVKKLGSTRVVNIPIAKIRNPFLATDRGIANKIIRIFRHGVRRSTCASTMVVTSNMRLERMLLHSRATSMFRPGMDSKIPSRALGTPKAENSSSAAIADPRCNNCTIRTNATDGMGTIQKRKHKGKRRD